MQCQEPCDAAFVLDDEDPAAVHVKNARMEYFSQRRPIMVDYRQETGPILGSFRAASQKLGAVIGRAPRVYPGCRAPHRPLQSCSESSEKKINRGEDGGALGRQISR
jgi:hypothetical protein